eukprot:365256-Chlamydomonas_euryale.AAC.4
MTMTPPSNSSTASHSASIDCMSRRRAPSGRRSACRWASGGERRRAQSGPASHASAPASGRPAAMTRQCAKRQAAAHRKRHIAVHESTCSGGSPARAPAWWGARAPPPPT